jgi:hypothetical protein
MGRTELLKRAAALKKNLVGLERGSASESDLSRPRLQAPAIET